jgi:hypothetical protein
MLLNEHFNLKSRSKNEKKEDSYMGDTKYMIQLYQNLLTEECCPISSLVR